MSTALLFSGQGAQVVGMGKSLYEGSPLAKDLYDRAATVLPFDLRRACFEGPAELLTETRVCQPALYVQGTPSPSFSRNAVSWPASRPAWGCPSVN